MFINFLNNDRMKKEYITFPLGVFWFFYTVVYAVDGMKKSTNIFNPFGMTLILFMSLAITISVVFLSSLPWKKTGGRPITVRFFIAIFYNLGIIAVLALLSYFVGKLLGRHPLYGKTYLYYLYGYVPILTGIGYLISLLELFETQKMEAEASAREAHLVNTQMMLMQSQLCPHTFYNSMNTVIALIDEDPKKASISMENLVNYYRGLTLVADRMEIKISEERYLIEQYLAFEKIRLDNTLKLEWFWDERLNDIKISPLLFQPLIENAIKHGIATSGKGGTLRIILEATEDGALRVATENNGTPYNNNAADKHDMAFCAEIPKVTRTGVGVKNLRSRLKLSYNDNATFNIHPKNNWTISEIIISHSKIKTQLEQLHSKQAININQTELWTEDENRAPVV